MQGQHDINQISKAFDNVKKDLKLDDAQKKAVTKLADKYISCSLKNPRNVDIVRAVNTHNHTKTCRKYGRKCRFFFPRFPSLRTIVSEPVKHSESSSKFQKERLAESKKLLEKVKDVLENEELMNEICETKNEEIVQYMNHLRSIQNIELLLEEHKSLKKKSRIEIKNEEIKFLFYHLIGTNSFLEKKDIENHIQPLLYQISNQTSNTTDMIGPA